MAGEWIQAHSKQMHVHYLHVTWISTSRKLKHPGPSQG